MNSNFKGSIADWFGRLPTHLTFVGLYVALDAVSFVHPMPGLNITPWNPAPALALIHLIRHGRGAWPVTLLAMILSEFMIHDPVSPVWKTLVASAVTAVGYMVLGSEMSRLLPRHRLLDTRRSLVSWFLLIALGTLLVNVACVSVLRVEGLLDAGKWWPAVLHFWLGDGAGIAIMMPLLWWLGIDRGRRQLLRVVSQPESAGYLLLMAATLWLTFGVGGNSGFKLFYLLFLPIAWAAARQGMAGAIVCAMGLQLGVILAVQMLDYGAATVVELQILALAMALFGFFLGAVVDEKRHTRAEFQHSLRLAAAGEMAGALAHELHQPLNALRAYAGACERLIERNAPHGQLRAAVQCVQREAARAHEAVQRLQDFYPAEPARREVFELGSLVEAAAAPFREQAETADVRFKVSELPEVKLHADRLQLEVVLRHLLASAFEAVSNSPRHPRRILIGAFQEGPGRVCLQIEDSGLGLTRERAARLFEAPTPGSMVPVNPGLTISRAIVETHGGRLWGEAHHHGIFKVELPVDLPSGAGKGMHRA